MSGKIRYVTNPSAAVCGPRGYMVDPAAIERAVHQTRAIIEKLARFEIDVFSLLGMRNLSSFVGEVFASALISESAGGFVKNPHQDGYPDLLLLDRVGRKAWESLANQVREKAPFSPYLTGGFEVKATCGAVPTPAQCAQRGFIKPDIGDQRVSVLTGYDWKAHHRETNHLFGVFWDFIDRYPAVIAVFYSDKLTVTDWGGIVQPRDGGGRTTSVSIMTRTGVNKMYRGWVTIANSKAYADFFDRRNGDKLLGSALSVHSADNSSDSL
jgi:hypothetical protein